MTNIGRLFIICGAVYALIGMIFGFWMGINQAFEFAHMHAHVNLIGWVTMALYGLVHLAHPKMAKDRLAAAQFWCANLGLVAFIGGLVVIMLTENVILVSLGSTLVVLGMIMFLVMFVRGSRG